MTWVFVLIAFTASSITAKEPTGPDGRPACSKATSAASRSGWPKGSERAVWCALFAMKYPAESPPPQ